MNDQYDNLLPTLLAWLKSGKKVAIATLLNISGGSPRPIGAQLLISDSGESLGAISSGCVEADIILAAREVITTGNNRQYSYGADSPFIDLVLPCGSSINITINMAPPVELVAGLCLQLQQRQNASLTLDLNTGNWLTHKSQHDRDIGYFVSQYQPVKRLVAIGKGVILEHVMQIAQVSGLEVASFSPDFTESTENKTQLKTAQDFKPMPLDSATAVLVLFHDHDWEPIILKRLINSEASYIGALGSVNSHQNRLRVLEELGCSIQECQKITSPAGLIKGTRHPQQIALSMVAQAMDKLV